MSTGHFAVALRLLLGGGPVSRDWVRPPAGVGLARQLLVLVVCAAAYGAAMGSWRAPTLALFVAAKAPVLLVAVALVNALVNLAFARRCGVHLSFAETLRTVLACFMLASIVLASLAPVFLYFGAAMPHRDDASGFRAHDQLGLAHIAAIAFAGTLATWRQMRWIEELGAPTVRSRVLVFVWLAVNLLAGAQIAWILRPWFGTPSLAVEFLRARPFDGNFHDSLVRMLLPH